MLNVRASYLAAAFGLVSAPAALPGVTRTLLLPVQGTLSDLQGDFENGVFTIVFSLYRTRNGGIPVWQEVVVEIPVRNSVFALYLGERVPIDANLLDPSDGPLFLAARVGDEPEMQRWPIGTVPREFASAKLNVTVRAMTARLAELEERLDAFRKQRQEKKNL